MQVTAIIVELYFTCTLLYEVHMYNTFMFNIILYIIPSCVESYRTSNAFILSFQCISIERLLDLVFSVTISIAYGWCK